MKGYECKCGRKLETAEDFSNHFTRDKNGNITGCKPRG